MISLSLNSPKQIIAAYIKQIIKQYLFHFKGQLPLQQKCERPDFALSLVCFWSVDISDNIVTPQQPLTSMTMKLTNILRICIRSQQARWDVFNEIFLNKQTRNLEFSRIICVYSFMLRTNLGFRARRCRGETRTCTQQSSVFSRRWSRVIFTWQTRFKSEEQFTEVRTYTIMPLPAKIINKLGFKQIIFLLLQVQVSHGHLDQ